MSPRAAIVVMLSLTSGLGSSALSCANVTDDPRGGVGSNEQGPELPPSQMSPTAPTARAALVFAQSFEDASAACNDWVAEGATSIRSIPPHSGDYACKVCSSALGGISPFALSHVLGPLARGRYVLAAWLRARPQTAAPSSVTAAVDAQTSAGPVTASDSGTLVESWARIETTIDLAEDASQVTARIEAPDAIDACLLVDDVTLTRVE